jgi:hypothetical protein
LTILFQINIWRLVRHCRYLCYGCIVGTVYDDVMNVFF